MNRTAFWLLLVSLFMTTSLTTIDSTAHFKSSVSAKDQASVARPVIQINALSDPSDLGLIFPGETKIYNFTVQNESSENGVSEVDLTYWLHVIPSAEVSPPLILALYYVDENRVLYPIMPDENGRYDGYLHMDTLSQSHHYQLHMTLPAGFIRPLTDQPIQMDIQMTAMQSDQ